MTAFVETARCGPFELVAQRSSSLAVRDDDSVELFAEHTYLVRLGEEADRRALRDALTVPSGGSEGQLRFGNFIGLSELGGRRLIVRSMRLEASSVDRMLDEVCDWFSSLPFTAETPVRAGYLRRRELGPDVLYHAFAVLRDAMRGLGPHHLSEALERILAHPHESLARGEVRTVPIGAASRVDAETMGAILDAPELLRPVPAGSRLARTRIARRLGGRLPEMIRVQPFEHSTDNPENRFVATVLETMIDILRRFERLAREEMRSSTAINAREAGEITDYLQRCRRHRVLELIRPTVTVPSQSTILRSRAGYRELVRLHSDLLDRSRVADSEPVQRLLELRDAADIYEYWCYARIVSALETILGPPRRRDRFRVSPLQAEVGWGFRTEWPQIVALYNASFPGAGAAAHEHGFDSYSLRLRPDITLRSADGRLNLFDAKLKRRFKRAVETGGDWGAAPADSFKPEDLHKMHAYRDALGADGVWVLYPGSAPEPDEYPAPPPAAEVPLGFQGVGAVALRPGAGHDGGLTELLTRLLGT